MKKTIITIFIFLLFLMQYNHFQYCIAQEKTMNISNQTEIKNDVGNNYSSVIMLIIGAILGFLFNYLLETIRNNRKLKSERIKGNQLLDSILFEINSGIRRCNLLISAQKDGNNSFSRIYITLWPSRIVELSNYIYKFLKDPSIIEHMHSIYQTFDLINFNMDRDRFSTGASFASDHKQKIEDNYNNLIKKLQAKKLKLNNITLNDENIEM